MDGANTYWCFYDLLGRGGDQGGRGGGNAVTPTAYLPRVST